MDLYKENLLKAENKNCGKIIQNQRELLRACNEKIKQLNTELREVKEKADEYRWRLDSLLDTYEACAKEYTENLLNKAIPVFCDKNCRYPVECQTQDELDEHCDNCDFIKILNKMRADNATDERGSGTEQES